MRFIGNRDIAISVENMDKAIGFYEATLGLEPVKDEQGLRVYDAGDFTLYVERGEPHPPVPSFTVPNLADARRHLVENGCTILTELGRSLYFRDPTGIVWDIIEGNPRE